MLRSNDLVLEKADFGSKFRKEYEPYLGAYRFEEWTFGEREDVIEQSSETLKAKKGEKMEIIMKSSKFRALTVSKCLKIAPFKISVKNIRDAPVVITEWFYKKVAELNEDMDVDEIKK